MTRPDYALVTGASRGLGRCFARTLAARKQNLALVARSEEKLEVLARELRTAHPIQVETIPFDLAEVGAGQQLEVTGEAAGGAGAFHDARAQYLMRVHQLPQRMLKLFLHVPGLEVHRPINDACVVQLGWRHPLRLESCAAVFEKERFYIFSHPHRLEDAQRRMDDIRLGRNPTAPAALTP